TSGPLAVDALSETLPLPALITPLAFGPFSGTCRIWPVVHCVVDAGTSAPSAVPSASRSGLLPPFTETAVTVAGVHEAGAGSVLNGQTRIGTAPEPFTAPSRSQPASPSKQRTSLPGFGLSGSKRG